MQVRQRILANASTPYSLDAAHHAWSSVVVSGSLSRGFRQATGKRSRLAERSLRSTVMAGAVILALGQLGVETTVLNVLTGAVAAAALTAGLLAGLGGKDVAASIAAGRVLRAELDEGQRLLVDSQEMKVVKLRAATVTLQDPSGDRRLVITYSMLPASPLVILPGSD